MCIENGDSVLRDESGGEQMTTPTVKSRGNPILNTSFRALSLPQGKESTFNEVRNLKSLFEKRHLCL